MKAVLQITEKARLLCEGQLISECGRGMCILLGIREGDSEAEALLLIRKILGLRIFADEDGKTNLSCADTGGDLLAVSNFTLYADCASRRPSFSRAMKFAPAKALYEFFLRNLEAEAKKLMAEGAKEIRVFPGVFGGDMKLELSCDGPFTILLDTEDF